jgi:hypothetical protein
VLRRSRVKRTRRGTFRVELAAEERDLLRQLLAQLRVLVAGEEAGGDDRVRRLFPTAYATDREADEEYQRLMRDELRSSRLEAVDAVEESLDADELDEGQLHAWMASVNAVRLVLGTMLDVSEDLDLGDVGPDDPDFEGHLLYGYLSGLLNDLVEAVL